MPQSFSALGKVPATSCESFVLWNAEHMRAIESVVMEDNRSVREYLSEVHQAAEIARLTGDGIRREGSRRLENASEVEQGNHLSDEIIECGTIDDILRLCAVFLYSRYVL
jgi:hypothetical protein